MFSVLIQPWDFLAYNSIHLRKREFKGPNKSHRPAE